jgi:hypothetical protein
MLDPWWKGFAGPTDTAMTRSISFVTLRAGRAYRHPRRFQAIRLQSGFPKDDHPPPTKEPAVSTTKVRRLTTAAACTAALLMGLTACGSNQRPASVPKPSSDTSDTSSPTPSTPTSSPTQQLSPTTHSATASTSQAQKVLVVIEENHSYAQMKEGMPFLAGLSAKYGYATDWTALAHPSLPNYLGIAGGTTFGILDDSSPAAHTSEIGSATSVFDQAIAAGKTAGTYAETMSKNCHVYDYPDRSVGTPKYAVRHNPWVYFSSGRSNCLAHDTDLTSFAGDAAANALPNVGFLVPNLEHDAHDASLGNADSWLEEQLTPVLRSTDFTSGKLVVVVTADEDDKHSGNVVLTSVLTPRISHKVVSTPLTHYSLTRYIAQVLGVTPLRAGATAPDMKAAFGL